MIQAFLKAKHWQIFALIFVVPFILQIILMCSFFSKVVVFQEGGAINPLESMKYLPFILLISLFGLFGWMYSIAIGMQKRIPDEIPMKVNQFKIFFYIPVVYISLMILLIFSFISDPSFYPNLSPGLLGFAFTVIIPLHLFSIFCMFYILNFVAKTYKTVELQRAVTFSDYAGEFFMFWFYFIGVWIAQPRINRWMENGPPDTFQNRDY